MEARSRYDPRMSWKRIAEALDAARSVAVGAHLDPDGDALGSALALAIALRRMGKRVRVAMPSPVARLYAFLPGAGRIAVLDDERRVRRAPPVDVLVALDCGDRERFGALAAWRRGTLVNIDHHRSNERFGDLNVVRPEAACTAILVDRLLGRLGAALDRDIATCLYTGVVYDTGRFMHPNTTGAVLRFAARLIDAGIDAGDVNRRLTYTLTPADLRARRIGLERLAVDRRDPRLAGIALGRADLRSAGAVSDWGDLVELPRSLAGVEIAYLLRERERDVRCSLRSNPPYAVGAVAAELGGGGHAQAAGCTIPGNLAHAKRVLLPLLRRTLRG